MASPEGQAAKKKIHEKMLQVLAKLGGTRTPGGTLNDSPIASPEGAAEKQKNMDRQTQ
jgi:hypothetical protein